MKEDYSAPFSSNWIPKCLPKRDKVLLHTVLALPMAWVSGGGPTRGVRPGVPWGGSWRCRWSYLHDRSASAAQPPGRPLWRPYLRVAKCGVIG